MRHINSGASVYFRRSQVRDGPLRAGAGGDVADLQGWGAGFIVACFFLFLSAILYNLRGGKSAVNTLAVALSGTGSHTHTHALLKVTGTNWQCQCGLE